MTDQNLPPLITTPLGRYRHYKGGLYEVVGTVRHSETLEPTTLYRALYGEQGCGCALRQCSTTRWELQTALMCNSPGSRKSWTNKKLKKTWAVSPF